MVEASANWWPTWTLLLGSRTTCLNFLSQFLTLSSFLWVHPLRPSLHLKEGSAFTSVSGTSKAPVREWAEGRTASPMGYVARMWPQGWKSSSDPIGARWPTGLVGASREQRKESWLLPSHFPGWQLWFLRAESMSDINDQRELFKVLLFTVMQLGLESDRRV